MLNIRQPEHMVCECKQINCIVYIPQYNLESVPQGELFAAMYCTYISLSSCPVIHINNVFSLPIPPSMCALENQ